MFETRTELCSSHTTCTRCPYFSKQSLRSLSLFLTWPEFCASHTICTGYPFSNLFWWFPLTILGLFNRSDWFSGILYTLWNFRRHWGVVIVSGPWACILCLAAAIIENPFQIWQRKTKQLSIRRMSLYHYVANWRQCFHHAFSFTNSTLMPGIIHPKIEGNKIG